MCSSPYYDSMMKMAIQKNNILYFIFGLYLTAFLIPFESTAYPPHARKETLTFKVKYFYFLPFGRVSLTTEEDKKDIHPVKQDLHLFPSKPIFWISQLKIHASSEKDHDKVTYKEEIENQIGANDSKTIIYDRKNNTMEFTQGKFQGMKKKVLSTVLDPFSLIFELRNIPFEKGKVYQFTLNTNQSNYILKCLAEGEEIVHNKYLGKVKTWKVHSTLQREDKLHKKPKLSLDIWITQKTKHLKPTPILAKANTLIGPFTMVLTQ